MYVYIYIYIFVFFSSPGKSRSNGNQQQTVPPIGGTGAQVKESTLQKKQSDYLVVSTCRKSRALTLTLDTKTILRLSALVLESVSESV